LLMGWIKYFRIFQNLTNLDVKKFELIFHVMKRMYVVLICIGLLMVGGYEALSQKSVPDPLDKRLQLREEMHRRMMDKLLHGRGADDDLFQGMDKMFEEAMSDSFSDLGTLSVIESSGLQTEWTESSSGRTLIVTLKDEKQQLDINIESHLVTIKGKNELKTPNGISVSSFSNSFSVPRDCDPARVKMDQKDGKILVHFPYLSATKRPSESPQDDRKPLPPSAQDVQI
jgi:HSP20 family molecular chaperone IbpA